MSDQTVNYARRHNYADTQESALVVQRWPVTPSRARRAAVDSTLAAYSPGNRAYQWVRVGAIASSPMPATPVLSLDLGSMPADVELTWTQSSDPDTTEVWRNVNGGPYAQVASLAGNLTSYHDTSTVAVGEVWCWKIRGVIAGNPGSFSNGVCALRTFSFASPATTSEPTWLLSFDGLSADNPGTLVNLTFANLLKATGNLELGGFIFLESMSLPALVKVDGDFYFDSDGSVSGTFTTFTLPALTSVGGRIFADSTSLVTLSFPLLAGLVNGIDVTNSVGLVNFSAPNLVYRDGTNYDFRACSLSAASIEGILHQALASSVTSATIQLEDGFNAGVSVLSLQGQSDYADLVTAGNTMSANP